MEGSYLSKLQKYEKLKMDNLKIAQRLWNTKSDITRMNLKSEAKKQIQLCSLASKNHQPVKLSNLIYETLASFKHQVNNF